MQRADTIFTGGMRRALLHAVSHAAAKLVQHAAAVRLADKISDGSASDKLLESMVRSTSAGLQQATEASAAVRSPVAIRDSDSLHCCVSTIIIISSSSSS